MRSKVDTAYGAKLRFQNSWFRGLGQVGGRESRHDSTLREDRCSATSLANTVWLSSLSCERVGESSCRAKGAPHRVHSDAGGAPCRRVYQLAQDKLKGIEADIEALKHTRRYMDKVLCDWEQRIEAAGPGEKSHLLYSLTDSVRKTGVPPNQFRRKKLT